MAENSKIEWTDHTFNPWMGCTKVSQGCKHCYAETLMDERYGKVQWGPKGARLRTGISNWNQPVKWNREAKAEGVVKRVFCASLADVFEGPDTMPKESWPVVEEARSDLWKLIKNTPYLEWLILTKRPENIMRFAPEHWFSKPHREFWPTNVRFGTSAEDQETAETRIPKLIKVPYPNFLSLEPLIAPIDLDPWIGDCLDCDRYVLDHRENGTVNHFGSGCEAAPIDWVIVGGESGPGSRRMMPEWASCLRRQSISAGVPFLFKQWGEFDAEGNKVGKHRAGRILDGRTWDGFPTLPTAARKEGEV